MNAQIKTMTALVRRELWEHRSFWLVPTVIASVMTLGGVWAGLKQLPHVDPLEIDELNAKLAAHPALASFTSSTDVAASAFAALAAPVAIVLSFIVFFYLLDSLYGDRRDRSVLFWRSMPVTDVQTVVSKFLFATLAGPLAAMAVVGAAFVVWGAIAAAFMLGLGVDQWWLALNPFAYLLALAKLVAVIVGFALVWAPFSGWLLLASAWAPRAPFLWAVLPPLGVALLEEMVFDSQRFADLVFTHGERLVPLMFALESEGVGIRGDGKDIHISAIELSTAYLGEPRLYIGLLACAALVAAAVYVRRFRDEAAY